MTGSRWLLAGAGKAPIDLGGILPFDGFDLVRDLLWARAVVFEETDGADDPSAAGAGHASATCPQRVCIVSLEVTSLAPALLVELRSAAEAESGCSDERLWVCVTHTFSAPHVRTPSHLADDGERRKNSLLLAAYAEAVRSAVRSAFEELAPVAVSVASGPFAVNVCRDVETPAGWWLGKNPEGFSDHEARVLQFAHEDGTVAALLFSADVQSSVLDRSRTSDGLRVVSGDLAGVAAQRIENALGGVALFVVGAAGDQAPRQTAVEQAVGPDGAVVLEDTREAGFRMLDEQGEALADDVLRAAKGAHEIVLGRGSCILAATSVTCGCPGQRRAVFHALAPTHTYEFVPEDPVETTIWLLRLGPVLLMGLQPEVTSQFGQRLRQDCGAPYVAVLTLVNGGAKYLPDDDAYNKITYEAMNSGFGRGSAEVVRQAAVAAARELGFFGPAESQKEE